MIKRLLRLVPELKQLRLSSLDCAELNEDFWEILKYEERLMPHLHISLQSGNDIILKRMKRRHSRKQAIEFCEIAKTIRPGIVFGADLIAGFPTENNKMFEETCSLINECDLTYLHVFPYSKREGTPAAKMPQVADLEKKQRAKQLRNIGNIQLNKYFADLKGKEKTILIEKEFKDYSLGKTQEYAPVRINSRLEAGNLFKKRIISFKDNLLIA